MFDRDWTLSIISKHHWFYIFLSAAYLVNMISQTQCQPLLFFNQILPRDSQVSHQPIQHLIIKQRVKHWKKKTNRKENNVNSIPSWLPGASYLISFCLPGCKFLRGKGCLNKCFVECLSQCQACVLAQ